MPNKFKRLLGQLFFSKPANSTLESKCSILFNRAHHMFKDNPPLQQLIIDANFQQQTKPSLEYFLLNHTESMAMDHLLQALKQQSFNIKPIAPGFFSAKQKIVINDKDLNQLYLPFQNNKIF